MRNVQPIEQSLRRVQRNEKDGVIEIHSVWMTMQGEGPFAGKPAVFIRLSGCNLQCPLCFHGNTMIRMADFSVKPISQIQVGDRVLSYDEKTASFVKRRVTATMSHREKRVYRLQTGGCKTYVTGNHPFFVRGKGWVEARELEPGDKILHLPLSTLMRLGEEVRSITLVSKQHDKKAWTRLAGTAKADLIVYNFEVAGTHTYIANGMVVHNCDTDYTSQRTKVSPVQLLEAVHEVLPVCYKEKKQKPLVVITGGEPMRQYLNEALLTLLDNGFIVQIETNGTLPPPDFFEFRSPVIHYIVSPKSPKIDMTMGAVATAFKYVIEAGHVCPEDGLPTRALGGPRPARPPSSFQGEVYVQPCDVQDEELNKVHLQAALDSCMKYGYRLSLQMHKLLGMA